MSRFSSAQRRSDRAIEIARDRLERAELRQILWAGFRGGPKLSPGRDGIVLLAHVGIDSGYCASLELLQCRVMPLFYFDIHDDQQTTRDENGMELPDLEAARLEAIRALPDIAREVLPNDGNRRDILADIRDETGRLIFTAHLSFMARVVE